MCYDVQQLKIKDLRKQLKSKSEPGEISKIKNEIWEKSLQCDSLVDNKHYVVSGFNHPEMKIIVIQDELKWMNANWGLVPEWVVDEDQVLKIRNSTINARYETIWEKSSFKDSAESKRCIVPLNSFYEHHHIGKVKVPCNIYKNDDILYVAGLYSNWLDEESGKSMNTFTIVTTEANELMTMIHNNPKMNESRMPLVLEESQLKGWLTDNEESKKIKASESLNLEFHTVAPIKGKKAIGNIKIATEEYQFKGLDIDFHLNKLTPPQTNLFG